MLKQRLTVLLLLACVAMAVWIGLFDRTTVPSILQPSTSHTKPHTNAYMMTSSVSLCTSQQRLAYIRQQFQKHNVTSRHARLFINDEKRLAYCAITKMASSTLKQFLVKLTSKAAANEPVKHIRVHKARILRQYGIRIISTRAADLRTIKDYRKIVVIRHPLDRLLSAFHDKFFHGEKWAYSSMVRRKLANRNVTGSKLQRFVKAVAMYGLRNGHWNPYSRLCHFTGVDYDDVIRVETFRHDIQLFLEQIGLNVSDLVSHHVRRESSKVNDLRQDSTVKPKYLNDYSEIPTDDLIRLKQIYADDLRLFGYDFDVNTLVASCSMTDKRGVTCC